MYVYKLMYGYRKLILTIGKFKRANRDLIPRSMKQKTSGCNWRLEEPDTD